MIRIGHGFDLHRFVEAKPLMLAGVEVAHSHGLLAHSDGDVILHALCDALLGAAAMGDIGQHFPDSDPQWQDQPSSLFIQHVCTLVSQAGYHVNNVDVTVLAETPRLSTYIDGMKTNLSELLALSIDCINIKATTMEGLGAIGEGQAMACHAVALISNS